MTSVLIADLASSEQGPTVSIESGELLEGGSEVTRLWALNVTDPPLCGFTIDVVYDPDVKDPTDCSADPGDNFAGALCNENYASDTVRVAGLDVLGVTGDIPLADITWTAVGSGGDSTNLDVQIVPPDGFVDCQVPPVPIPGVADHDGVNDIVDPTPSPSPSPAPPPPPAPTPSSPTPSPTVSPTLTVTPTPTQTPTLTPTPPAPATRTLIWDPGWHNETWTGASSPQDAFACAQGRYAAAYRLVSGGWERYFPDRPDMSNMGPLEQYDTFLILITDDVTCQMPVGDPPGDERTLDWGEGWQNEGWTGPDGTTPQDAFACVEGSYAAAYRWAHGSWERYFPDRPEISNMGPLNKYDAFFILITDPVSCTMPVAP